MKKLKLYKRNKSQKSKLSEIFDVVKNADQRACSLLTLLNQSSHHRKKNSALFFVVIDEQVRWKFKVQELIPIFTEEQMNI